MLVVTTTLYYVSADRCATRMYGKTYREGKRSYTVCYDQPTN